MFDINEQINKAGETTNVVNFNDANLNEIIKLQNKLNSRIDKDWINSNQNIKYAILLENAEMLDSFNWKWWKYQETDWENIEIEMVDLFHFLVSWALKLKMENLFKGFFISNEISKDDILSKDEQSKHIMKLMSEDFMLAISTNNIVTAINTFINCWYMMDKDSEELFRKYKMKYTLNIFRQNNGYSDGTYIKMWENKEDNVWAQSLQVDIKNDEKYIDTLAKKLHDKYSSLSNETKISQFIKSDETAKILFENIDDSTSGLILKIMEKYKKF